MKAKAGGEHLNPQEWKSQHKESEIRCTPFWKSNIQRILQSEKLGERNTAQMNLVRE